MTRVAPSSAASATPSTVDPAEVARFSAMAAAWWDPHGKFRPLHRLNPIRLRYIHDVACRHWQRDSQADRPLAGLSALDIGCGGGLLSEPLAALGLAVTGIDASPRNIAIATSHAQTPNDTTPDLHYRVGTAEEEAADGRQYDLVLAFEILEHVADVPLFLEACGRLLKPEGLLFLATLNRTAKSFALAIVGAEYILRWLPRGTHDWKRFLKPSELAAALRPQGIAFGDVCGVSYNPLNDSFALNPRDPGVNYMAWAKRTL